MSEESIYDAHVEAIIAEANAKAQGECHFSLDYLAPDFPAGQGWEEGFYYHISAIPGTLPVSTHGPYDTPSAAAAAALEEAEEVAWNIRDAAEWEETKRDLNSWHNLGS